MANFKRKTQTKRAKIMPLFYDEIVVPNSYDGGKARNRQEQRLHDRVESELDDLNK